MAWRTTNLIQRFEGEFAEPTDEELAAYGWHPRPSRALPPAADTNAWPRTTDRCPGCGGDKLRRSKLCRPCFIADRQANRKTPPPRGVNDPHVDEMKVLRVLDGAKEWCSRAEKYEVIRRWMATERSLKQLERQTGWNVTRDRKRMEQTQGRKAA